jgi:hypothetical protein
MHRARIFAICLGAAMASAAPVCAQTADCKEFRQAMARASGDLKADFVRPLIVRRGPQSELEQYDLISQARIDGVLRCKGEAFVSFEATIHMPADSALIEHYATAQIAALVAGLGWSPGRAREKVRTLTHDAADYLRGSAERGDIVVAGKLEEHLPGDVDLGVVWTATERTFILLNGG